MRSSRKSPGLEYRSLGFRKTIFLRLVIYSYSICDGFSRHARFMCWKQLLTGKVLCLRRNTKKTPMGKRMPSRRVSRVKRNGNEGTVELRLKDLAIIVSPGKTARCWENNCYRNPSRENTHSHISDPNRRIFKFGRSNLPVRDGCVFSVCPHKTIQQSRNDQTIERFVSSPKWLSHERTILTIDIVDSHPCISS